MLSQNDIKYINALKIKKYRYKYKEFIAEGPKIILDMLSDGLHARQIIIAEGNDNFESLFADENTKIVPENILQKITALKTHHNVIAIFEIPGTANDAQLYSGQWQLALEDIRDPGNMGTIIRTADWFGIQHIFCSEACVDAFSPKVVQASMGSIGRVKVRECDLAGLLGNNPGTSVYGGVLDGVDIRKISFAEKGVILIGNEGNGISDELESLITHKVTIPRIGKAESLNAAVAAALICSKACL